ncbi:MAG: TniQ family protein [Actinomycetota bacterium]
MPERRRPLTFIPQLLPDQTLYSWVAVYHHLSGNASEVDSVTQLFWSRNAGWHFHIPSHLDNFCASTRRVLGEPEELVQKATILPAYLWFRPDSITGMILERVRGDSTAGVAQMLGISHSALATFAPRRCCRQCVEADRYEFGTAYWHRSHQLPGVLICPRHQVPLHASRRLASNKWRRHFFSPEAELADTFRVSQTFSDNHSYEILIRLATLSEAFASEAIPGGYRPEAMQRVCVAALKERGLYRENLAQCVLDTTQEFTAYYEPIAEHPELGFFISRQTTRRLWTWLHSDGQAVHPLEHLLLIAWLFGTREEFIHRYANNGQSS